MRLSWLVAALLIALLCLAYTFNGKTNLAGIPLARYFGSELELVDDGAELLTDEEEDYIREYHQMLLQRFDIDYRVVTVNGLRDINAYAWKAFKDRKVGQESRNGRGLLLIIDPVNDQLRIEVSRNLESVFTDAFVVYLESRQMVPFFRLDKVGEGIFATTELIRMRAMDADKGLEFDPASVAESGGGGAAGKAGIGAGRDTTFTADMPDVAAADDPLETLERFLAALSQRNGRGDLDLFTEGTKKHMEGRVSSAAQMDRAAEHFHNCQVEHLVYNENRTLAVLVYALKDRSCDPFMFEKGDDGKWRLDLKAVGDGLGHTYGNIWYLDYRRQEQSGVAKYYFGFQHFFFYRPNEEQFDHQGIPYYRTFGMQISNIYDGALIVKLNPEKSYLAEQGIKVGDIIRQWESSEYPFQGELNRRMKMVRPGLDIFLRIRRGEQYIEKFIKAPPHPKSGEYRFGVTYRCPWNNSPKVHYVEPGGQADLMGVRVGDLITRWQGKQGPDTQFVFDSIREMKEGDLVSAEVLRGGERVGLTTTMKVKRAMGKVE